MNSTDSHIDVTLSSDTIHDITLNTDTIHESTVSIPAIDLFDHSHSELPPTVDETSVNSNESQEIQVAIEKTSSEASLTYFDVNEFLDQCDVRQQATTAFLTKNFESPASQHFNENEANNAASFFKFPASCVRWRRHLGKLGTNVLASTMSNMFIQRYWIPLSPVIESANENIVTTCQSTNVFNVIDCMPSIDNFHTIMINSVGLILILVMAVSCYFEIKPQSTFMDLCHEEFVTTSRDATTDMAHRITNDVASQANIIVPIPTQNFNIDAAIEPTNGLFSCVQTNITTFIIALQLGKSSTFYIAGKYLHNL